MDLINQIKKSWILSVIFRLLLGILFVYASFDKVLYPANFAIIIKNYQVAPDFTINLLAIIIPWLEMFCGIFLLIGLFSRGSALLLSLMLVIYIFALIIALITGLDIDCGCYGLGRNIDFWKIVEDVLLLGMTLHLLFNPSKKFALDVLLKRLP